MSQPPNKSTLIQQNEMDIVRIKTNNICNGIQRPHSIQCVKKKVKVINAQVELSTVEDFNLKRA